jgi:hypothetical protein
MNIGVFVGSSRIFVLGILIFKGLTARRLYKSFGVKELMKFDFSLQIFKQSSIKFHENSCSWSRVVQCGQT